MSFRVLSAYAECNLETMISFEGSSCSGLNAETSLADRGKGKTDEMCFRQRNWLIQRHGAIPQHGILGKLSVV